MARDVKIAILGDARDFSRAMGSASRDANSFGSKMSRMSTRAKAAFAGLGVAAIAFGKSSVDAFMEAEEAQSQLSAAFAKFPQLAGKNADALRELNTELAKKTKFDDDATAAAQANLAQYGLTVDQLKQITPLLQDYAEKTGKDLPTAATDLGKAILGQGRALKAVGIDFVDTGSAAGNFDQVMAGLTDKVGGFAEVAGTTTAGKVQILKNQFGELQEKVGAALVPALTKLADVLIRDVIPKLETLGRWVAEHKPVLAALGVVVGVGLTASFYAWAASIAASSAALLSSPIAWAIALVVALTVATQFLIDKFNLLPKASQAFNAVLRYIGPVVEALRKMEHAMERIIDLFGPLRAAAGALNLSHEAKSNPLDNYRPIKGSRAMGGPITAGNWLVGERGPEIVSVGGAGHVTPNVGSSVNITVNGNVDRATLADLVYKQRLLQVAMSG